MKTLKNYEEIQTEDGSTTLYSKAYGESCHSTSGARSETILHYVKGCGIDQISNKTTPVNVLEVGFGVGIGFQETLEFTSKQNCFLNFISFEIDAELIEFVLEKLNIPFQKNEDCYQCQSKDFNLLIFYGNARDKISKVPDYFNEKFYAIYQDAFSPKRNAILWTTEWFKDLKNLAGPDCTLSTYSSSSSIRKSLIAAGWFVTKGDKFGPKRSSTRANLKGITDLDILEHLKRSPAIEITDENYDSYKLEGKNEKNLNL